MSKKNNKNEDKKEVEQATPQKDQHANNDATASDSSEQEAITEHTTSQPAEASDQSNDEVTQAESASFPWLQVIVGVIALVIIILSVWTLVSDNGPLDADSAMDQDSDVVAVVDGTEIMESDLQIIIDQYTQTAEQNGADITDASIQETIEADAIEVLINTEILKQTAAELGYEADAEEVDQVVDTIIQENGGLESLEEQLAETGQDLESLRNDIADDISIRNLLEAEVLSEEVEITPEEIEERYNTVVEQSPEGSDLPALEEVTDQIEAQLAQELEQTLLQEYIDELRATFDVDINA